PFVALCLGLGSAWLGTRGQQVFGGDDDIYLAIGTACAGGESCPLGGPYQSAGVHLGPVYVFLLALLHKLGVSPRGIYWAALLSMSFAVAMLAGMRTLWGSRQQAWASACMAAASPLALVGAASGGHVAVGLAAFAGAATAI